MDNQDFILGDSIMAGRIRKMDWSKNPLGPIYTWPNSLKLYISQILFHQFPMLILWGKEYIQLHNDAFLFSQGSDPDLVPALGKSSPEYYDKTWHLVQPMLDAVLYEGKTFFNEDQGFPDPRRPGIKIAYYTYSYSPLRDDHGNIGGIMVTSIETTGKIESFHKLEESELRARLAIEAAEMGSYELDLETNKIKSSESFSRILGVSLFTDQNQVRDRYFQEDLKLRDDAFQEMYKTKKLDFVARFMVHSEMRWIQILGKLIDGPNKKPGKLIGVIQDITEKKLSEQRLIQANKNLQEAIKEQKDAQNQKDQFLQIASHELRTPLTAIKGYSQLAEEILQEAGLVKEAKMLEKMNVRIDHLHALVENLFDVSKINVGKFDFRDNPLDLVELLKFIVEDLRFTPLNQTIQEDYTYSAMVNADRDRVSQVITNLLANAIKYSPKGKEITVRTRPIKNFIAVDIIDQGIGISEEEITKIFDQFYRSKNMAESMARGLGLGLYLSAQIIKRKGGEIWAESSPGKGSTFTFTLPIHQPEYSATKLS